MSLVKRGSDIPPIKGERCKRCFKPRKDPDAPEGLCSISCLESGSEEVSQARLRALVLERDKGVCQEPGCGLDTVELRAELDEAAKVAGARGPAVWSVELLKRYQARVHMLVRLGWPRGPVERGETLWECAHLKARVQGGQDDPKNVTTLCLVHHREDTNRLASKRADSRKTKGSQWKKGRKFGR